jgi:dTDP-4-dehydrorhamnose 3,5-epimerase
MKIVETELAGVLLLEPKVFGDERGFFMEVYHSARYEQLGIFGPFVQDNLSRSVKGTLRGLHFQEPRAQGKLAQVLSGAVYDVVADVRRGSPTFGKWIGVHLSSSNRRQLWVPPGFAHGFCVLSESADFLYKCTELYSPRTERVIAWNDPDLSIRWPIENPLLSAKDAAAPTLSRAPILPVFSAPAAVARIR